MSLNPSHYISFTEGVTSAVVVLDDTHGTRNVNCLEEVNVLK